MKKNNRWLTGIALIVAVIGVAGIANAAVTVGYSTNAPTENVQFSFDSSGASPYSFRWTPTSRREIGQSFTAESSFTMESFSLEASQGLRTDSVNAAITVKVYELATYSQTDRGTLIGTSAGTYFSVGGFVEDDWITFDIDDVGVTSGKVYTVTLAFDEMGTSTREAGFQSMADTYSGGQGWISTDGTTWARSGGRDYSLIVQGTVLPPFVSYSTNAPTENVEFSFDSNGVSPYSFRWTPTSRREIGQSFTAESSFTMDSFSLEASQGLRTDSVDAAITVEVYERASCSQTDRGTLVGTSAGTYFSTGGFVEDDWITFDIDNVGVTSGKVYTITLAFDEMGLSTREAGFQSMEDTYSGGQGWVSTDGGNWVRSGGRDYSLIVQSASEHDPSTIASLSLFAGNVYEMVVDCPTPSTSYPKISADLVIGSWGSVGHSTNSSGPFTTNNLGMVSGTITIYLESAGDAAFFGIGEQ